MESQIQVYKFGGASVKDAEAVRNVAHIIQQYQHGPLIVVISAMGKTTNALEVIHDLRFKGLDYRNELAQIKSFHDKIAFDLGLNDTNTSRYTSQFVALTSTLATAPNGHYDLVYDQVVSFGEILSTALVSDYFASIALPSQWIDAREVVQTDDRYRDARVDWERSAQQCGALVSALSAAPLALVQGFIGRNAQGYTTTLGREGSDFTAAIMAYLFDAVSVTIWKDVPGMLNADPKWFQNTIKLDSISFREAIELAYYGASVIHPKTIQPLQNKGIPLYIKSFVHPENPGTVIHENTESDHLIPSYIFKGAQDLISFIPKDFSFIVEDNLRDIFGTLAELGIRVNLMENSAVSFSICIDNNLDKRQALFDTMRSRYAIRYNEGLTLITVRHWNDAIIQELTPSREVLLEQKSRQTLRMVVR